MKPVKFEEQNVVFAENQPEYLPLPAHRTEEGIVVTCWEPTEEEILRLIDTRKIYISQMTFNQPLQPLFTAILKEDIFTNQ
jgi:hypothetical protein